MITGREYGKYIMVNYGKIIKRISYVSMFISSLMAVFHAYLAAKHGDYSMIPYVGAPEKIDNKKLIIDFIVINAYWFFIFFIIFITIFVIILLNYRKISK